MNACDNASARVSGSSVRPSVAPKVCLVAPNSDDSTSAAGRSFALTVPFTGAIESALGELHRSWPGQR